MATRQKVAGGSIMYLGNGSGKNTTVLPDSIAKKMFELKDVVELRKNMKYLLAFRGENDFPVVPYGGRDDRRVYSWHITLVDEKYPVQNLTSMQAEQLLRQFNEISMPKRMFAHVGIGEKGEFSVKYGFGDQNEYTRFTEIAKTVDELGNAIKSLIAEFAKEIGLKIIDAG